MELCSYVLFLFTTQSFLLDPLQWEQPTWDVVPASSSSPWTLQSHSLFPQQQTERTQMAEEPWRKLVCPRRPV